MNKTLIAVAVSAATLAFGANADMLTTAQANDGNTNGVALYSKDGNSINMKGRIEGRLITTDGKANDATRVRIGFGGVSVINDNLYGVGYFENEYTPNDSNGVQDSGSTNQTSGANSMKTRQAYAGLGGNFGQVVYGKSDASMSQVTDFTDIMWSFGGNVYQHLEASDRPSNDLAYRGTFNDLSVRANYRFADQSTDANNNPSNNDADGYSTSAVYNIGATGVKVGAGYENQNKSHKYTLSTGYTIGNFYVAGLYTDGDLNYGTSTAGRQEGSDLFVAQSYFTGIQEYKAYELAASYTMGKTSFTTTYNKAKTDSQDSKNILGVEAAYAFTTNFRTYIGYDFNLLDEGDALGNAGTNDQVTKADASDQAMLGLRYDF